MKIGWWVVGCVGVLAFAPSALAHELECRKTVNGTTFLELDKFPATLRYELTVRNIAEDSESEVLEASDPLLESLGFEGFDTPFTLPEDGESKKSFTLDVRNAAECLRIAALDGNANEIIENAFTVRWNTGSDVCSAHVQCVPPESDAGPRMTGGGSIFGDSPFRVTHGFQLRCDAEDPRQNLEINWEGNRFHLLDLTSAECEDTELDERPPTAGFDTFIGTGTGRFNNVDGATVAFTFTDDGEPGVDDTAKIVVRDAAGNVVLDVEGKLEFGNHQAHRR